VQNDRREKIEIIHAHNYEDALIVSRPQWKAMGEAILKLIREPELAKRLGANARQNAVDNFDSLAVSKRVAAVYESLLNKASCQDETHKTVSKDEEPESVRGSTVQGAQNVLADAQQMIFRYRLLE
jgi:hypothetical protein